MVKSPPWRLRRCPGCKARGGPMRDPQQPIADRFVGDLRPVHEWAETMTRLAPLLYERDPELSRDVEAVFRRLAWLAADFDCIGTDDPAAPPVGAPARAVLAYLFRRWPERAAEYRRVI